MANRAAPTPLPPESTKRTQQLIAIVPFGNAFSAVPDPIALSPTVFVRSITATEYGTIAKSAPKYAESVNPNAFAVYVSDLHRAENARQRIDAATIAATYALNNSRGQAPLRPQAAFLLQGKRSPTVANAFPTPISEFSSAGDSGVFNFAANVDPADVIALYEIVEIVWKKHHRLRITLQRYCTSLLRMNLEDRVIELAIALESLISTEKTELKFKFSHLLAFASRADPENRKTAHKHLAKLYDARSSIVHGSSGAESSDKTLEYVREHWDALDEIARRAINYFLLFAIQGAPDQFMSHLAAAIQQWEQRVGSAQ